MKLFIFKLAMTLLVVIAFALPIFYPSLGSGFLEEIEILGIWGALFVFSVFLVFVFFYCKDLQKTLELITPKHRAAPPKSVWFMFLIPYNFIEDFFIVNNVAKSIENEAENNAALKDLKFFGLYSGIGWCTAQLVSMAPGYLGKTASLVALILWAIHWKFIRSTNNRLSSPDELL